MTLEVLANLKEAEAGEVADDEDVEEAEEEAEEHGCRARQLGEEGVKPLCSPRKVLKLRVQESGAASGWPGPWWAC